MRERHEDGSASTSTPLVGEPAAPVLAGGARSGYARASAEVAELADAEDSKSSARKGVGVRLPSSAVCEIGYLARERVTPALASAPSLTTF